MQLFCRLPQQETNITRNTSIPAVSDKKPSAPRKVHSTGAGTDTITVKWNPPNRCSQEIDYYEIRYKEAGDKTRWKTVATESDTNEYVLKELTGDTEYHIVVRAMTISDDSDGGGYYSEKIMVTTNLSLANALKKATPDLKISNRIKSTNPKVYKLPVTEDLQQRDETVKTRKCNFGMILRCIVV